MAAEVSEVIARMDKLAGLTPLVGAAASSGGGEAEDIQQGDEPGAGRGAMLAQTDSYEDMAAFLGPPPLPAAAVKATAAGRTPDKVAGSEGRGKEGKTGHEGEEEAVNGRGDTDSIDSIVERVESNIHRNTTIASIEVEEDDDSENVSSLEPSLSASPAASHSSPAAPTSNDKPSQSRPSLQSQASTTSNRSGDDGGGLGEESCVRDAWKRHRKHIFILSSAGKPIYTRHGDEADQASIIGVLQAIFMSYQHSEDCRDSLMSINAGRHRFVFLYREPLILVSVSRAGPDSPPPSRRSSHHPPTNRQASSDSRALTASLGESQSSEGMFDSQMLDSGRLATDSLSDSWDQVTPGSPRSFRLFSDGGGSHASRGRHELCESQHQLKHQLLYAYYQIVFVLTASRIDSYFKGRTNYDLRRQLTGIDRFTDNLMRQCEEDMSFLVGAVRCLPMEGAVRDTIAQAMAQNCKVKNLVFAILFAEGELITIVRHRNYCLHPTELHLLFNLVHGTESFKGAETWVPVCLPKFDPRGFLYAYVAYLDEAPPHSACLVLLSVDSGSFPALSKARAGIQQRLGSAGAQRGGMEAIGEAVRRRAYSMKSVGIPEIRHFVYKSKSASMCTSPEYDPPYSAAADQDRLMALYRHVHHRTHCASAPGQPALRMYFVRGPAETCIGWTTGGFEVYATFGPLVTKQETITGLNRLLRWIKKEEDKLFILNSLTIPPL